MNPSTTIMPTELESAGSNAISSGIHNQFQVAKSMTNRSHFSLFLELTLIIHLGIFLVSKSSYFDCSSSELNSSSAS